MYTQIAILFCVLQSAYAYTLVQVELKNGTEVNQVKELKNNTLENISAELKLQEPSLREIIFVVDRYLDKHEDVDNSMKKKPQKLPVPLDESVRPFTNGHGYQFAHWELINEHRKAREGDNMDDTTGSDSGQGGKDDDADYYDDPDARDEADKHDGNDVVQPNDKVRSKRHINYLNVPEAPTQRIEHQAIPDYTNRMLTNGPTFENSKKTHGPIMRDEHGNVLFDNMNTVFSGGSHLGNVPSAYGMNLKNDQGYSWNHINNMHNEPIYNQHYNQAVQQRPIESHTDTEDPQVHINEVTPPNTYNLTLCNDNLEANNNLDENNAIDAKVRETNDVYKESNANSSLNEVIENMDIDIVINTEMEIPEEKAVITNTVPKNTQEPVTNFTLLESIPEEPEPQTIGIIHANNYKTNDEKDKDIIKPLTIERSMNSVAEIEEETCTEFIDKIETESSNIKITTEANSRTEEKCEKKEKCKITHNDNMNPVNLNFDELFNTDKFWDWLSEWTTSYMEILNENIEVLVKDEVAKQLEEIQLKTAIERDSFIENERKNAESPNKEDEAILPKKI